MSQFSANDFQPVEPTNSAPSPAQGFSASDFAPVTEFNDKQTFSSSDFAPVTDNAAPAYTGKINHKYDVAISKAAKKHNIDPKLLRDVGMQETGLGTSPNFNPATGRDRDGNQGVGIFQLDPAAFLNEKHTKLSKNEQAILDRAASDPEFAADYAAGMLANGLARSKGNVNDALSIYNAGTANSSVGQAYARHTLAFDSPEEIYSEIKKRNDPKHDKKPDQKPNNGKPGINIQDAKPSNVAGMAMITPQDMLSGAKNIINGAQRFGKDAATVKRLTDNGKPLPQALSKTQGGRAYLKVKAEIIEPWNYMKSHPIATASNILGSLQRGVGGIADAAEKHEDFRTAVKSTLDAVFHPTEKNIERTTESIRKLPGLNALPTHQRIDAFVKGHVQEAWQPYASAILKGGEDTFLQTISDPGNIIGIGLLKAGGTAGVKTAQAAMAALNKSGIGHLFPGVGAVASRGHEVLKDVFVGRRDLDKVGFTPKGKKVRMAVENGELAKTADRRALDEAAAQTPADAVARLADYAHNHGNAKVSGVAASHRTRVGQTVASPSGHLSLGNLNTEARKLAAMAPEERAAYLAKIRNEVQTGEIARRTEELVKANPDLHKGVITDWKAVKTEDPFNINIKVGDKNFSLAESTSKLRQLGKEAVFANPVPHGIKNVGTLAYLAGGLPAVLKGFQYMAKAPDKAMMKRMYENGALPNYLEKNTAKSSNPLIRGKDAYINKMNAALSRMEHGWRAGLLDVMDQKLGKSAPGSVEELLKGHMVNEYIGDYRNQAAFVKMFEALGGPFVAFRLGIVPAAVGRTLRDNPYRLQNLYRSEENVQRNRSTFAKGKNQLEVGGPQGDFARLATDPLKYVTSPSTLGPAALATKFLGEDPTEIMYQLGQAYVQGFSSEEDIRKALLGKPMPGQTKATVADHIAALLGSVYGTHFTKEKTQRQIIMEKRKLEKGR